MIRIITKEYNSKEFNILTKFGLFTKFCDDNRNSIYVTNEQYAIGYCIQEIDRLDKKDE